MDKKIKKGDVIKIIASLPQPDQTEESIEQYRGQLFQVTATPNSKLNALDKNEIEIKIGNYNYILNLGEYELVV